MQRGLFLVLCSALLLAQLGCQSEDSSGAPVNQPSFPIVANDSFHVVPPNIDSSIELASHIDGLRGGESLASVESKDDNQYCGSFSFEEDDLSLLVNSESGIWCNYRYSVIGRSAEQSTDAEVLVFSSSASSPRLPSLSHAMTLTQSSISLDLVSLLGSSFPDGYRLATQPAKAPKVQGEESNLGMVRASGNTISYIPPTYTGWNRIVYTLEKTGYEGQDKAGTIHITVSDTVNQPPEIKHPKYNFNQRNPDISVQIHKPLDIDLSTFISEPDSQEWQLIYAQSFSGKTASKKPESITNKIITYTPHLVGKQNIAYTVADHYGGYSSGIIEIEAGPNEKAETWKDLIAAGYTYTKPKRYSNGIAGGYAVEPIWDKKLSNTIAGYSSSVAEVYCSNVGHLPSEVLMNSLRAVHYQSNSVGELNKWPSGRQYLIKNSNNNGYSSYDLHTGQVSAYDPSVHYYASCVKYHDFELEMIRNHVVADGTFVEIARLFAPFRSWITVSRSAKAQPNTLQEEDVKIKVARGHNGMTVISTASHKVGTYRFDVVNLENTKQKLTSPVISYIGNINTAQLTVVKHNNEAEANNHSLVSATYSLVDAFNNPLAGQHISFDFIASNLAGITVTWPTQKVLSGGLASFIGVTGANGKVSVNAKSQRALSDITVKATFNGASNLDWQPNFLGISRLDAGGVAFFRPDGQVRTWDQANHYCKSRGHRLPNRNELQTLRMTHNLMNVGWPITDYWTSNNVPAKDVFGAKDWERFYRAMRMQDGYTGVQHHYFKDLAACAVRIARY